MLTTIRWIVGALTLTATTLAWASKKDPAAFLSDLPASAAELKKMLPDKKEIDALIKRHADNSDEEEALKFALEPYLLRAFGTKNALLHERDPLFWAYRGAEEPGATAPAPGAWFNRKGKNWYIAALIPDGPLEKAGFKRGDQLLTCNSKPFHPLCADEEWKLEYRRTAGETPRSATVTVPRRNLAEIFAKATLASRSRLPIKGKTVGYLKVWTSHGEKMIQGLRQQLTLLEAQTDILILDLRHVLHQHQPGLIPLFLAGEKDGKKQTPVYRKNIVVLIGKNTGGGAEWLSGLLQNAGRGFLVGEKSAGAFLPTEDILSADTGWLWRLPVKNFARELGSFKQGEGLQPDALVADSLVFAEGNDAALTEALDLAAAQSK